MEDEYTLMDFKIVDESTLHMVLRIVNHFPFNDLKSEVVLKFAKEGPTHRHVCVGLSIEGICTNSEC